MKLKVAVKLVQGDEIFPKDLLLFVENNSEDLYMVLFDKKEVYYTKKANKAMRVNLQDMPDYDVIINFSFSEDDLEPKKGMPWVKSFLCGVFYAGTGRDRKKIIVEYLEGEIFEHNHGAPNIREVYLAMEGEMEGKICDYGESHKSFCQKTIAVKVIDII